MSTINHPITKNGLNIIVNEDKGKDQRFFEYLENGVTVRHFLKGVGIDDQLQRFDIYNYIASFDNQDNQIGVSQNGNLRVKDNTYDIYYDIVEANLPSMQSIHRRALNGLLEARFGAGFYAFNPIDNLEPFQPVVFTLSEEIAPTWGVEPVEAIEGVEGVEPVEAVEAVEGVSNSDGKIAANITDGSGSYDYSIDGGATWGTVTKLKNLAAGEYTVSIRDKGVANAWFRSETITLVIA